MSPNTCFGFQGSITFPLSSAPAGTSGSQPVVGRKSRGGRPPEREEWTSRMHVTLCFDVTANLCLRRLRDPARDYCSLVDVALYQILAVMITTT